MADTATRFGRRLEAIPALARFCERADEVVRAAPADGFWALATPFAELLATDVVEAFVRHELAAIAFSDVHFVLGSSDFHAPLVEAPAYSLVVKVLPPDIVRGPLATLTEHTMLAPWDGGAECETLSLEPPIRNDIFDRTKRLQTVARTPLAARTIAAVAAPAQAFRLHFDRPTVFVQLQSATVAALRWVFDPATLEPVRAVASRLSSSRLQFTCQTLGVLGSPSSIPALRRLTTHPEHYVRWAAIQGICAISREDGIDSLQHALRDDHPHIRRAATRTLAICQLEASWP